MGGLAGKRWSSVLEGKIQAHHCPILSIHLNTHDSKRKKKTIQPKCPQSPSNCPLRHAARSRHPSFPHHLLLQPYPSLLPSLFFPNPQSHRLERTSLNRNSFERVSMYERRRFRHRICLRTRPRLPSSQPDGQTDRNDRSTH